ncbi:MAG: ABC transporter permease [Planctomycetia bacterium]|nr:MAG: ABC transporter permease [Planctomycetia bacterium]
MRATIAIMQRELLSMFCTPIGYVVIAGFLLILGVLVILTEGFEPGQPATLRNAFGLMPFILAFVVPAIAMRTLSEEYRNGTIEGMMTAPISDAQLVLGKFLGSAAFYAVMLATSLIYPILMQVYGSPDWGAVFSTYVGLMLIGLFFLAVSIFTSSFSSNQIIAWITASVLLASFAVGGFLLVRHVGGFWRQLIQRANVMGRFEEAALGLFTTGSLVCFGALAGLFLFLTIKVVESRRWR